MDINPVEIILHLDVYLNQLVNNYGVWIYAILFW
jgi:membrane-associated protein